MKFSVYLNGLVMALLLLWMIQAEAGTISGPWPAPNTMEAAAMEEARALGLGTVTLVGPERVTVRSHQTWTLRYTAGPAGLPGGGQVLIAMRHMQHLACQPQTEQPGAVGYVTATGPADAAVVCEVPKVDMMRFFAWQHVVRATVTGEALKPGETLEIVLGDTGGGGPGMRVQPYDEPRYVFKPFVDLKGDGNPLPLPEAPSIEIVAGEPAVMTVLMPSDAVVGEPTWCLVRVEDVYGNPATEFRGTVALSPAEGEAELPVSQTFTDSDGGVYRYEGIVPSAAGVLRLEAAGEGMAAASNPVVVAAERPENLLLWGDLHGHTLFSDGRGTVEEFYDFAERVAGLDFCAVTDHAFEVRTEMWEHSKVVTNRVNKPGRFVTFNAFEWSGATPLGGDHNVFFLGDDPPIFRSALMYDERNLQMDHEERKYEHVTDVFAEMNRLMKNRDIFCIPHYGGRKGNPEFHDPVAQRMIEIFSEHQRSHDWAGTFLSKGYRLGIMASTDGHYGNPGYGFLKYPPDEAGLLEQEIGTASVAVYAPERTRASIFESLYNRRVYATSGDRIVLDMSVDGHPMGSEYSTASAPAVSLDVIGTDALELIEFKKNGKAVHSVAPEGDRLRALVWQDADFDPAATAYYYVRVLQRNGEEAISSPVWVN